MSMKLNMIIGAVIASIPVVSSAQDAGGAITLGYGASSVSGATGDLSTLSLDGVGNIALNNNFNIGFYGSLVNVDEDRTSNDVSASDFGLTLNYQFVNGVVLGGYFDYATLDLGTFTADIDATSYGGTLAYVTDTFGAEAFLGATETSPSLPSGVDWVDYGLNLRYVISPQARIGGHAVRSDISGPGGDIEISSYGIGGDYGFGAGWSAFGGLSFVDLGNANVDATTFGVGVGYDLKQISSVPAAVSLELSRTDLSQPGASADVDTIRLSVTLPLGNRQNANPLNSVSRSAMSPRHNAVSTLLDSAF
ncbi:hypothetical protein ROG8370_00340 [Roseovarius gaetbuli]|uniref:Porin domain-containing protein n=1 Tax=Roseovarius gaetbuli TaxID=1356575 RepID=A0A1X6Y961_9RHOB|nr:porin [Roseovarius gaetbuli]SLN14265.1 hypothetical protein ROG8370_00340 [Roseovarius gaetbuli]